MQRVLIIEDDVNLRGSLAFILEREGFVVDAAGTGEDGLEAAHARPPHAVVLDVNLPGIDGYEVCRRLRRHPGTADVPIMMVTARAAVDDIVQGFETCADDYLVKPFHPRVLLARLHALLRRRTAPAPAGRLTVGDLAIDLAAHEVHVAGHRVELTRTEFALLHLLASHPNRVFSRQAILDEVRGEDVAVTDRTVDFQIVGLRRKLGDAARRVETVRGLGYKFAPEPAA